MPPGSLARVVFGRTFRNPVLLAAGTAGFGREVDGIVDLDRLGGLVTKAVSLAPRQGNAAPRVAEFPGGMLNSVGLANPGLAHVRDNELPWLTHRVQGTRILVNVVGFSVEEYVEVVRGLEGNDGITAFEINLSCPNTSAGGIEFGADSISVRKIISGCCAVTRRPVVAKLSPVLPDLPTMALVARDAGAAGVSLVNTFPGQLLVARGISRLGHGFGGVSGPSLLPVGVLATRRVKERAPDLAVIGVGGIRSAEDAQQYLWAGASLVAIGTAGLADPRLPERVVRDLERARG